MAAASKKEGLTCATKRAQTGRLTLAKPLSEDLRCWILHQGPGPVLLCAIVCCYDHPPNCLVEQAVNAMPDRMPSDAGPAADRAVLGAVTLDKFGAKIRAAIQRL